MWLTTEKQGLTGSEIKVCSLYSSDPRQYRGQQVPLNS